MKTREGLCKYQKVQLVTLGLIAPLSIVATTSYWLTQGVTALPTRGDGIFFYGSQAYLVSTFWYGSSLTLFMGFCAFPLRNRYKSPRHLEALTWFGGLTTALGLFSGIYLVVAQ